MRPVAFELMLLAVLAACSAATEKSEALVPISDLERRFGELSPAQFPRPLPDVTNRFADDPRAANLGQQLFFDPSFSGRLIDSDNDGNSGTLGMVGETGKVMCAACHNPSAGFVDARS